MDRKQRRLHDRVRADRDMGSDGTDLQLLEHVAARDQHCHDHRDVPDGVSIQRAQNKDARAIQLKLNELVAAIDGASNRLVDVENLSEDELETLHRFYSKLAHMAQHDADIRQSHSIDEAHERHARKLKAAKAGGARG